MIKAIQVAVKLSKSLESDNSELLEEYNLHKVFQTLYEMKLSNVQTNTLVAAIIFSYDSDSKWCDLKKTSNEDKVHILKGLGANPDEQLYQDFITFRVEEINDCIGEFLDMQPDWRFAQIRKSRDYHSKAMKEQSPLFTGVDDDKTSKAQENFGKYLREALSQRKLCDEYISLVEKDYVNLNHRTKQDFSTDFTEYNTQTNPESWRDYIRGLNNKKLLS